MVAQALEVEPGDLEPCQAIGVMRGNELAAGVVYHEYRPEQGDCEMSIAARTPRWASRAAIRTLLAYPFVQLDCRRVTARVRSDNERALRFDLGIGFQVEGRLKSWYAPGVDCVMLGLMRDDWKRGKYG
jgi:RimJ/RimL family protein N-acetyltransferase